MANFNDIGLSTDEVVWMAALQAILSSSLIMDPSSDSNIPTNSKRFELVGGVWELQNWNGSSWATIPLNAQRLQGNQASDIDYSAGDGIDISGSNVISVETATTGNRGGVLLATNADRTSTSRAATPAGVQDAIGDISLDNYTPGDGIDISGSNAISVEVASTGNRGGVLLATNADRTSTSRAATPAGVQSAISEISVDLFPPGFFNGFNLTISSGDSDHDVEISRGSYRDSNYSTNSTLSSPLTKRIDATWSQGDNQGGRASSISLGVGKYYAFLITKSSDGTTDVGFDTSISASNLIPSVFGLGFNIFYLLGGIRVNPSSNISDVWDRRFDRSRVLVDKYTISNETTILLRLLDPKLFKRYQIDIDGLKVGDVEVETANPIPPHIPPTITTVHTGFPLIRMANTSTMPTSSPYDWSMRQHNYGTSSSASGGGGRDRKGIAMYTNQDGLKTTAGATYNASINCFNFNDASSWSLIDFNGVFSGGAYHQPVAFNGSGRYDQLVTTQYVQLMTTLSTATAAPITGGLVGGVVSVYGVV